MKNLEIKIITAEHILDALPLLKELNEFTDSEILKDRLISMSKQHYECLGVYFKQDLIGICGLWHLTRHYCGKTLEPDHVIISKPYRSKGIGKILFEWIYNYAQSIGYESIELNTYISNLKSHAFYENEGFEKLGFHYLKKI
ncbi:hypothetical protein SAMN05444411_1125 [Lutibacter oricola]|uniref:N-acetyltransferase domain-containing protein n=1 Tax=Lutibacter oricola TaxID=762486 RepID=A0A1H3FQM7_9FLAO|nr:GNAT family N-acetyltransferase [Lutibacter oricola]SDX92454.1 hypothetical protein SAMN05444411_1125 [Lutibacter oricola]